MRNAECTPLTPEEEKELFAAFPRYLSDDDEALARKFFPQYVFFNAVEKNTRHCVCTSCMEGFLVDREIRPDFFKIKHKGVCECPNCGQRATLLAMGKYTNFENLRSHERAVQISAWKDWLLVQAGYVFRRFDHEDLGGYIHFEPFRMYAFAPGRRVGWQAKTYSWFGKAWWTDGMWERMERIKSPFQARAFEAEPAYWWKALKRTNNESFLPLFFDEHRYLVLKGGGGSGKSIFAGRKVLERCIGEPGHRWLVCRKVGRTLRDSCFAQLRQQIADHYPDRFIIKLPTTRETVRRRYGVDVSDESESEPEVRGGGDEGTAEDALTQYIGFAVNEAGGIDRYSWVNDVELEDLENYQARRQPVCAGCGRTKPLPGQDVNGAAYGGGPCPWAEA